MSYLNKLKTIFLTVIILFVFLGFKKPEKLLSIKVNTLSKNENVVSTYSVEKWNKNSSIVSVSFTNKGNEIEYIKNLSITIDVAPKMDDKSLLLFGSYQMGRWPVVQEGIADTKNYTESVLMVKNGNEFFKTAVLTWEIFRPEITYSVKTGIQINADGQNKPILPGQTIQFEKLVIESGDNWQNMLFDYGKQIAKVQNIKSKEIKHYKGWSTWDYYAQVFTHKEIDQNIQKLKELNINPNLIQIDGGWWTSRGDYLSTRPDIEGGMKGMAKLIRDNGFTPGLHIDGFRADKESQVHKNHPEWFLKFKKSNSDQLETTGYFDYSNPGACEYIKIVLKTMREEWGYKYFKIDFMCYGMNKDILRTEKLKKEEVEIIAFNPAMTDMERTRAGLKAMREGVGNEFLLGCSSVFGPTIGIVDGLRTGGDISPVMEFYSSRCLQNGGNFYLNSTLVQVDSDYLVVRNKDDEEPNIIPKKHKHGGTVTLNQANMWADYVSLFGGIKISSDNLNTLRPERKNLIKKSMSMNTCNRYIPIDFWDKARSKEDGYNIMIGSNDQGLFLVLFNWNTSNLGIKLAKFNAQNIEVINNNDNCRFKVSKSNLDVTLKPQTSVVFKLKKGSDFDTLRKELTYEFYK